MNNAFIRERLSQTHNGFDDSMDMTIIKTSINE